MDEQYKHLFGPVPSRRFGRSLGVDLVPFKTCTLDCVFCQLGLTTNKTLDRREYVSIGNVKKEIAGWTENGGQADFMTLSGSGEPTLNTRFGEALRFIRDETPFPSVLLSNGTLFWMPEVRQEARNADVVKLSLSAWDRFSFKHVNRPHTDLDLQRIVAGQRLFRDEFEGKLWLEVFLVWGMNSSREDVERIAELVAGIEPDEVHLNTAARPPAEGFVEALPRREMQEWSRLFDPPAKVIGDFPGYESATDEVTEETILGMLCRRPCTLTQIASAYGLHVNEVTKYLGNLLRAGKIRRRESKGQVFYERIMDSEV